MSSLDTVAHTPHRPREWPAGCCMSRGVHAECVAVKGTAMTGCCGKLMLPAMLRRACGCVTTSRCRRGNSTRPTLRRRSAWLRPQMRTAAASLASIGPDFALASCPSLPCRSQLLDPPGPQTQRWPHDQQCCGQSFLLGHVSLRLRTRVCVCTK